MLISKGSCSMYEIVNVTVNGLKSVGYPLINIKERDLALEVVNQLNTIYGGGYRLIKIKGDHNA